MKPTLTPKLGVFPSHPYESEYFSIPIINGLFISFLSHWDIRACVSFIVVCPAPRTAPDTVFNKYTLNERKKKRGHFSLYVDLPGKI